MFSFFCVASESFGPIGGGNGKVVLNSAYANTLDNLFAGLFGVIVIAAIFGTSILRDFQRDTYQILFTQPISKFAYLGGRWAGSFVTTVFAFSGHDARRLFSGTFAPPADHTRIVPNHLSAYLQPFFSILVVQIFFIGSAFFAVSALTRKIFVVYLQGVALFMIYVIGITVFFATRSLERFWSGILDPVGFILFNDITRYWTVVEKNTLFVTLVAFSRQCRRLPLQPSCCGSGIGVLSLVAVWALFPMSVEALTARSQGRRAAKAKEQELAEAAPVRSGVSPARLAHIHQAFNRGTTFSQYLSLTRLRLRNILRDVVFLGAGCVAARLRHQQRLLCRPGCRKKCLARHLPHGPGRRGQRYPVPLDCRRSLRRRTAVERARHAFRRHSRCPADARVHRLALPPDRRRRRRRLILLAFAMLVGIFMQTIAGYHHYELAQYFKEFYVVTFPQVLTFILLALFVQTVVSNKFVGHGIVIGVFVLLQILPPFGWENTLYLFGQVPAYTYSDMNGYGHFVPSMFWSISYWLSIAAVLWVISFAFARRGAEDSPARPRPCWPCSERPAWFRPPCFSLSSPPAPAPGTFTTPTSSTNISMPRRGATSRRITSASSRSTKTCSSPRSRRSMPPSTFIPSAALSTETSA